MEFDDDMYDADAYDSCDENETVDDDGYDMAAGDAIHTCMKYTVLSLKDICERQHNAKRSVSNVLSVSEVEAAVLLRHFDWDVIYVNEKWFANEEKVRNDVGLLLHQVKHETKEEEKPVELITCPICFDNYNIRYMMPLKYCGHLFCKECWRRYIQTSINNDGSGCLALRCPHPDPPCRAVVSEGMVFSLGLPAEDNDKYRSYLVNSYVEQNSKVKWCPAPNCEYAVEVDVVVDGNASLEVVCKCSYKFCWNCLQDSHSPIECDTVRKWDAWISGHGELLSVLWKLRNTKPCPMCKRPIEKNRGCIHMHCTLPCGFEFCWICLRDWNNHDSASTLRCSQYQDSMTGNNPYQEETIDEAAGSGGDDGERLGIYLVRWHANDNSQKEALSRLKRFQEVEFNKLSDCLLTRMSRPGLTAFKCVEDAWLQIVECRHMLKWTYAYGYYLPLLQDHDNDAVPVIQKQNLFEFIQGEAENCLQRLHQYAESELQHCIDNAVKANGNAESGVNALKDFEDCCLKLEELMKAAAHYFEKLLREVGNVRAGSSRAN